MATPNYHSANSNPRLSLAQHSSASAHGGANGGWKEHLAQRRRQAEDQQRNSQVVHNYETMSEDFHKMTHGTGLQGQVPADHPPAPPIEDQMQDRIQSALKKHKASGPTISTLASMAAHTTTTGSSLSSLGSGEDEATRRESQQVHDRGLHETAQMEALHLQHLKNAHRLNEKLRVTHHHHHRAGEGSATMMDTGRA